jgi:putative addiction module CopG family antidote
MNQTINISLPKGLAELAEAQVKSGYFSSVSEVIRHAIRHTFMEPAIPTYKMSKQAEAISNQARQDHKAGKTIRFKTFKDLV